MEEQAEPKEWVRFSQATSGATVTVTLSRGPVTVRWAAKTYASTVADGLAEACAGALRVLTALEAAL